MRLFFFFEAKMTVRKPSTGSTVGESGENKGQELKDKDSVGVKGKVGRQRVTRVLAEAEAGKKWKQWRQKGVLKAFSDMDEMEDGGKCMRVWQASSRASILSGIRQSLSQKNV